MNHRMLKLAALGVSAAFLVAGTAHAGQENFGSATPDEIKQKGAELTPDQFAEWLIKESGSFYANTDHPFLSVDEQRARLDQDPTQAECSKYRNNPPDEVADEIRNRERARIPEPANGLELGDHEKGHDWALGGFGWRIGHNVDDHGERRPDGGCYNCHQIGPLIGDGGGTVGPSLREYGKMRGDGEDTRQFVWDVINNAHAYFPCSQMPRFTGLIDEDKIHDLMAYLLDPESPVNTGWED